MVFFEFVNLGGGSEVYLLHISSLHILAFLYMM